MSAELTQTNSTVQKIVSGQSPSIQDLEALVPLLKMTSDAIDKCRDHIKQRVEGGDEIKGCKMLNGKKSYKVDVMGAYAALKDRLGPDFDQDEWRNQLSINKTGVEKVITASGEDKKKLEDLLGPALAVNQGKPYLRIG